MKLMRLVLFFFLCCSFSSYGQQRLWYDKPAEVWEEALPIGNGPLGAMIFGGTSEELIQFNEETLWTGGPRNYNKKDAHLYLDSIRSLLNQGKQREAEQLASREFMGLKSATEDNSAWLTKIGEIRNNSKGPFSVRYDDRNWKVFPVPTYEGWETAGLEAVDGAIWFRREFHLTDQDLKSHWALDLNRVRDVDYTYVNGRLVGHTEGEGRKRLYELPVGLLKKGRNVVAVQVINFHGKGGISGYKDTTQHIGLVSAATGRKISLNGLWKYEIQTDSPPKVGSYQASYQPFGEIRLTFPEGDIKDYKRELDLEKGEVRVRYSRDGVRHERRYFASHPDQLIGMQLTADQAEKISLNLAMGSKHKMQDVFMVNDHTVALKVNVKDGDLWGVAMLRIEAKGGKLATTRDHTIQVSNANEVVLYLSAATNFIDYRTVGSDEDASAKAMSRLSNIESKSFEDIQRRHRADYQSLYHRFSIELGQEVPLPTDVRLQQFATHADPDLLALYVQFGRYLQIASSRPGSHPANLQGIWNHLLEPSWGSKYTTNINVEMNYWPVEFLNLSELHEPLFQMIRELSEAGTETAKSYYGARGWVLHHNTDIWRGTAPINNANHGIWPTGGAWLVHHLWERYLFDQDLAILEEYYDVIKGATLFFKDFLVKDPESGYWVSTPSNSPEHGGLVKGPTMDHQLIRNLFRIFEQSSSLLARDVALRDSIRSMVADIAPNQIGKYGQLQEWMQDVDDPKNDHRHVSHLWALHPGSEINWEDTPDLVQASKQSLMMRGDEGTGWSLAWKINFWARIKDAPHTMKMIGMLLRPADRAGGSYPNLFDAHPPFQIDGNFGGAAGIAEMLLQSHTSYVELLPALPDEVPDGKVRGIKARGGFELDLQWVAHELVRVVVRSNSGKPLSLKYKDKTVSMETGVGQEYSFDKNLVQK